MKARVIAFYLPQFHPIPENDKWWGKGFTEWTNVGKAKALFQGHYQPHVPADLGYYDLRVPEIRVAQAEMAKKYGIEGFMYWHYWFGNGKRLLERPFSEVLKSGSPDFPFALAWANESWKGFAHGLKNRNVLIEQSYPGEKDYIEHFYAVLPAFKDKRYLTVEGKPIFMIYKPELLPNPDNFICLWNRLAVKNGLKGICFVAHVNHFEKNETEECIVSRMINYGFSLVNIVRLYQPSKKRSLIRKFRNKIERTLLNMPLCIPYKEAYSYFISEIDKSEEVIPTLIPNWDHTPRSGRHGLVLTGSTPDLFRKHTKDIMSIIVEKKDERRIVFVKSWNEWAEGNYLEPDLKWGTRYLDVLRQELK